MAGVFQQVPRVKWRTIYVEGHSGDGSNKETFRTWVSRPNKYRSEEGPSILVKNDKKQIVVLKPLKKVREFEVEAPTIRAQEKAALEERMAVERAKNPTLASDDDLLVNSPVNDFINPSYFVRRELKSYAKSVEKVGLETISGRKAMHLKVLFPKELAKEDYWDVYIDCETGLMLGLVINPIQGQEKSAQFIDKIQINPVIDQSIYNYEIPVGYTVECSNK